MNRKHIVLLLAFFIFIPFIIYWKIPLLGLIPFPGDLLVGRFFPFNSVEWLGYPNGVPYKEFINADVVRQLYPWRNLAITTLKSGQLPGWNPYAFSGNPLLANIQSAAFYPLNILYWLMSHQSAWIVGVLLQPILAMIFMYMFTKELKFSSPASILSSLAFAFSGYMVVWWEFNTVGHAALWAPLILWAIERFKQSKHSKYLIVISFALSASLLAGHLQTSIYVTIISITYAAFRLSQEERRSLLAVKLIIAMTTSILIAFPQLLPALKFAPLTPRGTQPDAEIFMQFRIPLENLITFLSHDYFGNPAVNNFWGKDYGEFMAYFGVIAFIMSLFALQNNDRKTKYFFVIAGLALISALKTPLPLLLHKMNIPVLSTSAPSRAVFIVHFAASVLAGYGFDAWKKYNINNIKKTLILVVLIFAAAWIVAFIGSLSSDLAHSAQWKVSLRNLIIPTGIAIALSALTVIKDHDYVRSFKYIWKPSLIVLFSLVIGEYVYFANKYQTFSEPQFFFPKSPVYEYLRNETREIPYRFFGDYTASVTSNSWLPYNVYGVEGYDGLYLRRYGELLISSHEGKIPVSVPRSDANLKTNSDDVRRRRLQDLLGVKFILDKNDYPQSDWDPDPVRFPEDRYQLIWQKGKFKVYENLQVFPRAYLVSNYLVEKEPQNIIDIIFNENIDLTKTLVLEEDIKKTLEASEGLVQFQTYAPNIIELVVDTPTQQLLFLSDSFHPDWQAFVDQDEVEVYRADYAFRAILIPSGQHKIKFTYKPTFLR